MALGYLAVAVEAAGVVCSRVEHPWLGDLGCNELLDESFFHKYAFTHDQRFQGMVTHQRDFPRGALAVIINKLNGFWGKKAIALVTGSIEAKMDHGFCIGVRERIDHVGNINAV